jgi:hypothetical protein
MRFLAFITFIIAISTSVFAEQNCSLTKWQEYRGTALLQHPDTSTYAYATTQVKVDADGAPNAYHPDDIGLHCTKGTGFKGLDCPANAGYPNSNWWQSALLPDPANPKRAFIQPSGEFAGFFVSQTTLKDKSKPDTDPAKYVDSRTIPYIIFPRNFYKKKGTGGMGDLGYAINLRTGEKSPFVVAEIGPSTAKLGEMSLALATALGGNNPNPRTGTGTPNGTIVYVMFPASAREYPWPLSPAEMAAATSTLLDKIGGMDAVMACKDAF